jgi:hypothetical protein
MAPRKGGKGPTKGGPEVPIQGPFKLDGQKAGMKRVRGRLQKAVSASATAPQESLLVRAMTSRRTTILNLGGGGEVELVERPLGAEALEIRRNLLGWPGLGMKASRTTRAGLGPTPTRVRRKCPFLTSSSKYLHRAAGCSEALE